MSRPDRLDVSIVGQPVEHLRHRRGRPPEALGQACLDDRGALFGEGLDRLEVLLEGRVETFGHVQIVPDRPDGRPQNFRAA